METNCQFKSATKRISRELKNLLLDNIAGKYIEPRQHECTRNRTESS